LAPLDNDWLYVRAASISYQLYMRGKIGITALRDHYGGRQRNGTCKPHHRKGAGKVIRYCIKQLEDQQLIGHVKYTNDDETTSASQGKALTKKGITDMDRIASQIMSEKRKAKK